MVITPISPVIASFKVWSYMQQLSIRLNVFAGRKLYHIHLFCQVHWIDWEGVALCWSPVQSPASSLYKCSCLWKWASLSRLPRCSTPSKLKPKHVSEFLWNFVYFVVANRICSAGCICNKVLNSCRTIYLLQFCKWTEVKLSAPKTSPVIEWYPNCSHISNTATVGSDNVSLATNWHWWDWEQWDDHSPDITY